MDRRIKINVNILTLDRLFGGKLTINGRQPGDLLAFARVHQQRSALDLDALYVEFAKSRNQRDWKVIDAVET